MPVGQKETEGLVPISVLLGCIYSVPWNSMNIPPSSARPMASGLGLYPNGPTAIGSACNQEPLFPFSVCGPAPLLATHPLPQLQNAGRMQLRRFHHSCPSQIAVSEGALSPSTSRCPKSLLLQWGSLQRNWGWNPSQSSASHGRGFKKIPAPTKGLLVSKEVCTSFPKEAIRSRHLELPLGIASVAAY